MHRYGAIIIFLLLWAGILAPGQAAAAAPYVAYSFNAAESRLKANSTPAQDLTELGGITRVIAIVYDQANQDLILVGTAVAGEPKITLDDLVVALRALLLHKKWPLVSIDKTVATQQNNLQSVLFDGGIANTQFGRDLFDTDVLLKKWVLGQQALDAWGIKSYFDLYGAYFQENRQDNPVQSRFWFKAGKCFLAVREGVAVFEGLSVMVQTEVMNAMLDGKPAPDLSKVRDPVGEKFSTALTDHYADLSGNFAEIKRLNLLYSLVGLAAGIHKAQTDFASFRPRLDYWLSEYRVPEVKTPQDYPLIVRKEMVGSGQHSRWMSIDGGIELKALMVDLNDGVVGALRDIVLKSRPDGQPLTWEAPLQDWHLPGAPPPGAAVAAPHPAKTYGKLGCMVTTIFTQTQVPGTQKDIFPQSKTLPPLVQNPEYRFSDRIDTPRFFSAMGGPGGVLINPELKKRGTGGAEVKKNVEGSRPSEDSLSWPISGPKGGGK